jgi:hypothetical protein
MALRDWSHPEVAAQHLQVLLLSLAYKYEGRGSFRETPLHPRMSDSLQRRGLSLEEK